MFTIIACFAVVAIAVWTDRQSDKEMVARPSVFDDDLVRQSVVFVRRDLRLIAWVLARSLSCSGSLLTGYIDQFNDRTMRLVPRGQNAIDDGA
jgi:hypothetical protein